MRTPAQVRIARARRRRFAAGLGAGATLLLAAVLAGMVHYLGARHYARWDWSRARFYGLSDKSKQVLASLDRDIEVVVFFQAGREVFADVDALLQEYRAASPRLRVSRVDPDRDLARTEELKQQFPLCEANTVLFHAGDRWHMVKESDLAARSPGPPGEDGAAPAVFRGEQLFTSAIQGVTQARRPVVYVLAGHGERALDNYDKAVGLADLARVIRQDNIELRTLRLGEGRDVPADADALLVAGPRLRFAQPELDLLARYLDHNGRAVFLLDSRADTGLASLFGPWGLRVGDDLVIDPTRTLTGRELFVTRYGMHPVTERLAGVTCILYLPRSVEAAEPGPGPAVSADRPRVVPLAFTSPAGWAETDPDEKPLRFDPGRDRRGPVAVAAAVERGPVPGIDVQIRPTRLVVFGDSYFVSNEALAGGNADLFMAAMNWLLSREELAAVAPKPVAKMRLRMTAAQLRWLAVLVLGVLPACAGGLGLLVGLGRRR